MSRARGSRALALSAVTAACIVVAPLPPVVHQAAAFWLLGVLPGWLARRALPDGGRAPPEEMAVGALVGSVPVGMLLAVAGTWLPTSVATLAAGLALVLAAVAMSVPSRPGPRPAADPGAWLVCLGAGLVVALPLATNPVVRFYGDAMFHGQIVYEILTHGLPPQDPSFAGQPLAYAWLFHAWVAGLARLGGVTPYQVFPWVAFASATGTAFVFLRLARACGATAGSARVAVPVILCAMNAFGWLQASVRLGIAPMLGRDRGGPGLAEQIALLFTLPDAAKFALTLVYEGHYVLSSFLYKFLCVNSVGVSLMLAATAYLGVVAHLKEGGVGSALMITVLTAGAALVHPVVGLSAAVSLGFGLIVALAVTRERVRGTVGLVAVLFGIAIAIPALLAMLATPIHNGVHTRVHLYPGNAFALVQALALSAPLAALGWRRGWQHDRRVAALAAGYTAQAAGICLFVEFPSDAYAYPVYLAYLGTATLIPFVILGLRDANEWPRWRAAARYAALLLPLSTAFVVFGFLLHDESHGFSGFPRSPNERAIFDRLASVPDDAIVIDTQNFQMSAAAAYSARRSLYGGARQVEIVGYPVAKMDALERAIRDLLYAPTTSESTWRTLEQFGPVLYIVARRAPSLGRIFDQFEDPAGNPIAKLDSLAFRLEPVLRTPTIALYRQRAIAPR